MLSANRLKFLKKLKQKKYRVLENLIIIEGLRLINQLINNKHKIVEIYYTKENPFNGLCPSFKIDDNKMQQICTTVTPQNIAALIKPNVLPIKNKNFLLYLDDIKDPGNLGTIFRTALAGGVSGILLSKNCCEVYNPKVIRSSMAAIFNMPYCICDLQTYINDNTEVIASSLQATNSIFNYKPKKNNTILVIGSEAFGVNKNNLQKANTLIKIPQTNKMESLNAAVATGILIFNVANAKKILS